ncbi:MAG: hypothetical protein H7X80_01670, partial [bacterium]|nr:hypothetical protein [Candidatus Kapabacteria bacterium]
ALTIVGAGGEAIVPNEPYASHSENLLPVRTLALWSYTDLNDHRLNFGKRFTRICSDTAMTHPLKLGMRNQQGWAGWHRNQQLFMKRFACDPDQTYPDMGSNTEVYTAGDFIELESLGAVTTLAPSEAVDHVERWSLHDLAHTIENDEQLATALEMALAQSSEYPF